jgi:hypothetical protein
VNYQKWLGRTITELQSDDEFRKFFAFAELYNGDDDYYLSNKVIGIDAVFDNINELHTIHFYSKGYQNFSEFKELLPLNLRFELNDSQITELLGNPQKEGGDDYSLIYGLTPKWHKYLFNDFDLHLQYRNRGESIEMITLMKPGLI